MIFLLIRVRVTGIDLSPTMVAQANTGRESSQKCPRPTDVQAETWWICAG